MFRYLFSLVEHHATFLHYDFRIALAINALSFAMKEGPSMIPKIPRLAIEMPRHSLKSMFSEKPIPTGFYGAGERRIWDWGYLILEKEILTTLEEGYAKFFLDGSILRGYFEFKICPDQGREWELTKLDDQYADPKFVLIPKLQKVEPGLARDPIRQPTLF